MLFEAASELGAHHVKVGDFFNTPCPMPQLIEAFTALCKEASNHGTRIGFELMPFANIHTLESALELVKGTNASNGGIIFDLWHIVKLGIPYDSVARFPKQYFYGVEINDGYLKSPPGMDFREETTGHRKLCGMGEFDIKGFVTALENSPYRGPIGIEVLSKELRTWPLDKTVTTAYRTTREQFG